MSWRRGDFEEEVMRELKNFGAWLPRGFMPGVSSYPECDFMETEGELQIRCDIPGLKKQDLEVDVNEDVLTISGKREEVVEKTGTVGYKSRRFGSFSRSFSLPRGVDPEAVTGSYRSGVLEVTVPKPQKDGEDNGKAVNIAWKE